MKAFGVSPCTLDGYKTNPTHKNNWQIFLNYEINLKSLFAPSGIVSASFINLKSAQCPMLHECPQNRHC